MRNYLIIILILISTLAFSQESRYSSDFEYFIEKLTETHPDPYSGFGGRIEFSREKENTKGRITDSMTSDEFIILMNQFLSNLNDGHTSLYFAKSENKGRKVFPLQLKISSDKIFVQNTTKDYENLTGSSIVGINNVSIDKWLLKTKSFFPSENI